MIDFGAMFRSCLLFFALILTGLMPLLSQASDHAHGYSKNSLDWPIQFRSNEFIFGPLIHQFQFFVGDLAYFHEGLDLLGDPHQKVHTPVSGYVDAGYYSYSNKLNGHSEKTYLSIRDIDPQDDEPKLWGEVYFEVSVTDSYGTRFEFHHIDRKSLPPEILDAIKDQTLIAAGQHIGSIFPWPRKVFGQSYDHIHYAITTKSGEYYNPLWFSSKIEDKEKPQVDQIYYQTSEKCPESGRASHLHKSTLNKNDRATHIILKTHDKMSENHFSHTPTRITATFENGEVFELDFSLVLKKEINLNDVYLRWLCLGNSVEHFVLEASQNFTPYIKIPLPSSYKGTVDIKVYDFSGNETSLNINTEGTTGL